MKYILVSLFIFSGNCMDAQTRRDSFLNFLENINERKLPFTFYFKEFSADADWMYDLLLPYIEKNKNKYAVDYYAIAWILAFESQSQDLNKKVVNLMIGGVESTEINTKNYCIEILKKFKREQFGKDEILKFRLILQEPKTQIFDILLLCGFLNLKSEKRFIRQGFIGNYQSYDYQSYYKSNEWAAYLALARMGDKASIQYVLQKYRSENDLWEKCLIMSTQLDYVKRKETHNELINIFISDLAMPPDYPAPKGILCGQGFINFLAKSIKNYPYPIKRAYYPEDIEKARAWFATRPKIIINRDIF